MPPQRFSRGYFLQFGLAVLAHCVNFGALTALQLFALPATHKIAALGMAYAVNGLLGLAVERGRLISCVRSVVWMLLLWAMGLTTVYYSLVTPTLRIGIAEFAIVQAVIPQVAVRIVTSTSRRRGAESTKVFLPLSILLAIAWLKFDVSQNSIGLIVLAFGSGLAQFGYRKALLSISALQSHFAISLFMPLFLTVLYLNWSSGLYAVSEVSVPLVLFLAASIALVQWALLKSVSEAPSRYSGLLISLSVPIAILFGGAHDVSQWATVLLALGYVAAVGWQTREI